MNFLRFEAVIAAIPKQWFEIILNEGRNTNDLVPWYIKQIKADQKPGKRAYQQFRNTIATTNIKSEQKWQENLNIVTDESFWADIYTSTKCTKETKLRNFQYKLLTRILPTNKLLYTCKLKETQLCSLCGLYTETLEHLFYDCKVTYSLLLQLTDWLATGNIHINLNQTTILLGYLHKDNLYHTLINHIILIFKYFIFTKKLQNKEPSLESLKQKLLMYYELEKMTQDIIQKRKTIEKWEPLLIILDDPP